jgi:hypothetical protein
MIGILGGSALLIVTMCCGLGLWFAFPPEKKPAAAAVPLNDAPPDTPITRAPQAGPLSWVPQHPLAAADNAAWKVTAEPTAPPPGLLSVVPLVHRSRAGIHFSAPSTARVGLLQPVLDPATSRDNLIWTIYDLRQPLPVASVKTFVDWQTNYNTDLPRAAMSQSGKLIVVAQAVNQRLIRVWSDDGQEICTIPSVNVDSAIENRRLLFAGDSRLAIDTGGQLIVYELPAGKELFRKPAPKDTYPLVSVGGKWLIQVTPKAVYFLSTDDGSEAGKIELGEHWKIRVEGELGLLSSGFALHPNGRSAAIIASNDQQDLLVAHFDLATGAFIEQVRLPWDQQSGSFWTFASWCGERKLLFTSGQVFDLDLKTYTSKYGASGLFDTPDGRFWRLVGFNDAQLAAVAQKLGIEKPPTERALAAVTLPDERVTKRLNEAQQTILLHPGMAIALSADESVPPEYRQTVLGGLADGLAELGFKIDPAAKIRAKITQANAERTPNLAMDGRKLHTAQALVQFFDVQGKLITYAVGYSCSAQAVGPIDAAWLALGDELKKIKLPRMYRALPDGRNAEDFSEDLTIGIDGHFGPGEVNNG